MTPPPTLPRAGPGSGHMRVPKNFQQLSSLKRQLLGLSCPPNGRFEAPVTRGRRLGPKSTVSCNSAAYSKYLPVVGALAVKNLRPGACDLTLLACTSS